MVVQGSSFTYLSPPKVGSAPVKYIRSNCCRCKCEVFLKSSARHVGGRAVACSAPLHLRQQLLEQNFDILAGFRLVFLVCKQVAAAHSTTRSEHIHVKCIIFRRPEPEGRPPRIGAAHLSLVLFLLLNTRNHSSVEIINSRT